MRRSKLPYVAMLAWLPLGGAAVVAQDRQASTEPAFEVASVKAHTQDGAREALSVQPDGSARFTAFHVRTLITIAYRSEGIQRFDQLVGAPSWLSVERFDIAAKAGVDSAASDVATRLPAMLRTLLRDRFGLRLHVETRDRPAYGLVLARRDGRLGSNLRASSLECPAAESDSHPDKWCGIRVAGGLITGRAVSAAYLAGNLAGYPTVDRFVTDRTGLTGRYDFTLEYSPALLDPGGVSVTAGPSLFTALTEQLGLSLRPETKTVPVLVIDHIERPTPD
jgi:bla regulator protein blaR1